MLGLVLLVRMTSTAQMGDLMLFGAIAAFAAVTMSVGGPTFVAIEMGRVPKNAGSVFARLAKLRLRFWVLAVVVLFAYGMWNETSLVLPVLFSFILLVGGVGVLGAGSYGVLSTNGALDALGRVELDSLFRFLGSCLCLLFLVIVFLFPELCSYEWLPLAALIGGLTNLLLGVKRLKPALAPGSKATLDRSYLRLAIPLWLYAILGVVQTRVDLLFLENYLPKSGLATYAIAGSLAAVLILPAGTLGRFVAPVLAAPARSEHERLMRLVPTFRILVFGLVPLGILLACGLSDFLLLPFGEQYAASAPYLRILSIEVCTTALFFVPAIWLAVTNKGRWFMSGIFASAASALLLNYLLIPRFGAMGAAWAHLCSLTIGQLVHVTGFAVCVLEIRRERRLAIPESVQGLPQDSMPIARDPVEVQDLVQSCSEDVDGTIEDAVEPLKRR